jgi:hypothetical protein
MMPDKETRDIQAYLNRTLPRVRREKFEQRLLDEPEFRARFEELKPLLDSIEMIQMENHFKEMMNNEDQFEEEHKPAEKLKDIVKLPLERVAGYAVAASVILLLGVFWYDSTLSSRLYDDYYKPEMPSRANRTADCPDEATVNLYYQKEYTTLLQKLAQNPLNPCRDYYEGLGLMALNQTQEAQKKIENALQSSDKIIKQSAEWYLGLLRLKQKDTQKAIDLFTRITATPEHQFGTLAKDILKDLEEKPIIFRQK